MKFIHHIEYPRGHHSVVVDWAKPDQVAAFIRKAKAAVDRGARITAKPLPQAEGA